MKKLKIDWYEFDRLVEEIFFYFKQKKPKVIVGISRGGLPLAVKLSNLLQIPMIPLEWQTRDGSRRDVSKLTDSILRDYNREDILFVDDICDSAKTLTQINSLACGSRWCTLATKQWNKTEFSPIDLQGDKRWVVFPWEV